MIRLIATDMDGTLLDDNKNLPEDFPQLVSELDEVRLVIASGRSYQALRPIFDCLGNKADDLVYICDNGANLVMPKEKPVRDIIPAAVVRSIVDDCLEAPSVIPVLCGVRDIYFPSFAEEEFRKEISNFYVNFSSVEDIREVCDDIIKIAICDLRGADSHIYPVFREKYGSTMNVVVSGFNWMDIMNKGTDKGEALKKIQAIYGIKKEETLSFGDYFNDAPMLDASGFGYVMANACDKMKEGRKFIAPPNTDNGVVRTIKKHLEI